MPRRVGRLQACSDPLGKCWNDLPAQTAVTHNQTVKSQASVRPRHPNRIPFEGILTRIGAPSDKSPGGARGHRVILTQQAIEDALGTLRGMGVAFKTGWKGHDARQKCGIITAARIEGNALHVRGFLYGHDFPEIGKFIASNDMGMSYEVVDAHVEDMRAVIWTINRVTFTGAAILLREKAAYASTRFTLFEADANSDLVGDFDEDLIELA